MPKVNLAIVGVSRDCFSIDLTKKRLSALEDACKANDQELFFCKTIIESENDVVMALDEATKAGANAAVIYLGNFGPEGPSTIFAEKFNGPVMLCGAAEESMNNLKDGRGDALCGMLNASYNSILRNVPVYIPGRPIGLPDKLAQEIKYFHTLAKVAIGVKNLKIMGFGPRPHDFYACNAPLQPLYDLGIEVMENSELDLLQLFEAVREDDPDVKRVVEEMTEELGERNTYPDLLPRMARLEVALMRFFGDNLGTRKYGIFASKCWPAFEKAFKFVPCYVNSRLAAQGIPVGCEVDIYGVLSEYICQLVSNQPATILDINNSVPADMADLTRPKRAPGDLFMGFHCGNTPSCHMKSCGLNYQLIMNRLMEDGGEPDITRGTLEGQIKPGRVVLYRLQGNSEGKLHSYVAQGEVLDVDPRSFGGIGVFAVQGFERFYRHVLLGQGFPHHAAVAFGDYAKVLVDATKMLRIMPSYPKAAGERYEFENPYS